MRRVSLLAPDSVVRRELSDAYGSLVTPALLSSWTSRPALAPGRRVSSPWPARVDIESATADGNDCVVRGHVMYVTNADTASPVERRPVTIRVTDEGGWRVSAYHEGTSDAVPDTSIGPAAVLRRYYDAIQAGDFAAAHQLWSDGGASGRTRAQLAEAYAGTQRRRLTVTDSARLEGAAGTQYATVPVTVEAVMKDGTTRRFEGTYTLRRSMVDGATPEQRRWRIHAENLRRR